jgi:hypothetical protein
MLSHSHVSLLHLIFDFLYDGMNWDECQERVHANSVDSYMNVKLTNTDEWKDGKNEGTLGEVFIRYVTPESSPRPLVF